MRSILAILILVMGAGGFSGQAGGEPAQGAGTSDGDAPIPVCAPDANVDTCWEEGVAAEKRGDAKAALAAYEASCAASLHVGGCYDAGKIYFLNVQLRDYGRAQERMDLVCASDDVGLGPYACKYLGVIHRKGLTAEAHPDRAFAVLSRSCFLHNPAPFIDGNGCEILADTIPNADEMGVDDAVWEPEYIAYLALVMGCSDDMPALCERARAVYRRSAANSAANSARWFARCTEDVEAVGFTERCEDLSLAAAASDYEARQTVRRRLVRMYRRATEYAG